MANNRLPVDSGRTPHSMKPSNLARVVGGVLLSTAVLGLWAMSFSTASRAEIVPAITENSVPQLKVQYPPYPVFTTLAAIRAAYPPGATNVWVDQLSNYGGYDKAFFTDVQPLPGCGSCYTEPLGYTWVGQFVQISPYCLYANGSIVSPIGYTLGGVAGDPICPSRLTCPASYTLTGDGMCWAPDRCPVEPLTPLPDDACTQSLEAGRGQDINGACPALTDEMQRQERCLADKITALNIPYNGPTAGVRTAAYQAHLLQIWNNLIKIDRLPPAQQQLCTARYAELNQEKSAHGLTYKPGADSEHVEGRAIDISKDTVNQALHAVITNPNFIDLPANTDVWGFTDYLYSSTWNPSLSSGGGCSLYWAGRFKKPDIVHFEVR